MPAAAPPTATSPYRVLARKYRPVRFADLIGQAAMVRTLTNAIAAGRLAHAFVLTGVRGVGKTTTARIIARALNCIGADGNGGPTADPCGVCEHCVAIAEDRHIDVIEMDAASRTGVEDIRELIDGVRYRPVSARYKVYIVDEVHMLSKNAFNALLKTLEEPPEHVKFVFATTEIRKVPITVLSRCQRFDLRRVDQTVLAAHLADIARREGRAISPAAAALLARAADGSVRDGLSLLDRALAHVDQSENGGEVGETATRGLLGLADRTQIFDLFASLMTGEAGAALGLLGELYRSGADPLVVAQDLLELAYWVARLKITPDLGEDPTVPEAERARGLSFAKRLSLPVLARTWQMLLKGLGEAQVAPSPLAALEMLMIRLCYAAELPTPGELIDASGAGAPGAHSSRGPGGAAPRSEPAGVTMAAATSARGTPSGGGPIQARRLEPDAMLAGEMAAESAPRPDPRSFLEVVALFAERREGILHAHLLNNVHLVGFEPGRIEFRPGEHAPRDLATRIMELLQRWTGRRWVVAISREAGEPTLGEQEARARAQAKAAAASHPLVQAVLEIFPGASIEVVRGPAPESPAGAADDAEAEIESTSEPLNLEDQ